MYKIRIEEYKFNCIIGCHHHERENEQTLLINLELTVNQFADYEKMMELCKQIAQKGKYKLIEDFMSDFFQALFKQFPILSAKMAVSKPKALIEVKNVTIEMQR